MKTLICYFSASGVTKKVAQNIATVIEGDLFEIEPVNLYTKEDLDWTNKESRSSKEMKDLSSRPAIKTKVYNLENYDRVLIGFPVWWYTAPTIINTFIEQNDLSNKKLYVFVTSGSSSVTDSFNNLKNTYPNLDFVSGIRFTSNVSDKDIKNWLN